VNLTPFFDRRFVPADVVDIHPRKPGATSVRHDVIVGVALFRRRGSSSTPPFILVSLPRTCQMEQIMNCCPDPI